ncbi:hypothetical protein CLOM_g20584 [Closterium sp. NIES-68]|nr:hypothetical protein CLOM_g20584 [Closterium sp. NIES-68]GJP69062.1 hypothetical protein CLOP_g25689 [Closterium sp. NIES-67]
MEERSGSPARFRIGYALVQKKINSFLQEKLKRESIRKGIELVQIDLSKPLSEQGPFDAILHKIPSQQWYEELEEYQLSRPDVLVIDPPEAISRLYNRISMLQAVDDKLQYECGCIVGIPKQIVVHEKQSVTDSFATSGLSFPVIAKPLLVDGTPKSHLMWLVYNEEGLKKLLPPFVLQQFVNHGGVIFKVYVVGNQVKCLRRKSLPDPQPQDLANPDGLRSFCQVSNLPGLGRKGGEVADASLSHVELPPADLMISISSRLRKNLGLRLFNFDLIRDRNCSRRFYIVDINYFPGFAKMPGYEHVMSDFFASLAKEKRTQSIEEPAAQLVERAVCC